MNFEDFDPNNPSTTTTLWGVWADASFKIYTKLSPAMSRWAHWPRAKMYRLEPGTGTWSHCGTKDRHNQAPVCTICGATTEGPRWDYYNHAWDHSEIRDRGEYVWERAKRKLVHPLRLHYACRPCRDRLGL